MQLERNESNCPICGSYLSGGQSLSWGRHTRCPACQASAPSPAADPAPIRQRTLLVRLRRQFRRTRARMKLAEIHLWG